MRRNKIALTCFVTDGLSRFDLIYCFLDVTSISCKCFLLLRRLTRGASSQLSSPENSIAGMRADADVESGSVE